MNLVAPTINHFYGREKYLWNKKIKKEGIIILNLQQNKYMGNYLEIRDYAYDILRGIFLLEPTQEQMNILQKEINEDFPFIYEHSLIEEGVTLVIKFYENYSTKMLENIQCEYTRLFIGPGKVLAPLWESAYMNEEQLLFQEETLKVRWAYLKYSLATQNIGAEADDHLGLELDFLYQLNTIMKSHQEKEHTKEMNQVIHDQIIFLDEHLLKWVPHLKDRILISAKYGLYKGIAKILHGFLEVDRKGLRELLILKDCQKC